MSTWTSLDSLFERETSFFEGLEMDLEADLNGFDGTLVPVCPNDKDESVDVIDWNSFVSENGLWENAKPSREIKKMRMRK